MMDRLRRHSLVLACGNPLRGDDGVAWRVADALREDADFASVELIVTQQWLPEHAEAVSRVDSVIFVDCSASGSPGGVEVVGVKAANELARIFTHDLDPASLLGLSKRLYSRIPSCAFVVTIEGESFALEESLSVAASDAIPIAVASIRKLLEMSIV